MPLDESLASFQDNAYEMPSGMEGLSSYTQRAVAAPQPSLFTAESQIKALSSAVQNSQIRAQSLKQMTDMALADMRLTQESTILDQTYKAAQELKDLDPTLSDYQERKNDLYVRLPWAFSNPGFAAQIQSKDQVFHTDSQFRNQMEKQKQVNEDYMQRGNLLDNRKQLDLFVAEVSKNPGIWAKLEPEYAALGKEPSADMMRQFRIKAGNLIAQHELGKKLEQYGIKPVGDYSTDESNLNTYIAGSNELAETRKQLSVYSQQLKELRVTNPLAKLPEKEEQDRQNLLNRANYLSSRISRAMGAEPEVPAQKTPALFENLQSVSQALDQAKASKNKDEISKQQAAMDSLVAQAKPLLENAPAASNRQAALQHAQLLAMMPEGSTVTVNGNEVKWTADKKAAAIATYNRMVQSMEQKPTSAPATDTGYGLTEKQASVLTDEEKQMWKDAVDYGAYSKLPLDTQNKLKKEGVDFEKTSLSLQIAPMLEKRDKLQTKMYNTSGKEAENLNAQIKNLDVQIDAAKRQQAWEIRSRSGAIQSNEDIDNLILAPGLFSLGAKGIGWALSKVGTPKFVPKIASAAKEAVAKRWAARQAAQAAEAEAAPIFRSGTASRTSIAAEREAGKSAAIGRAEASEIARLERMGTGGMENLSADQLVSLSNRVTSNISPQTIQNMSAAEFDAMTQQTQYLANALKKLPKTETTEASMAAMDKLKWMFDSFLEVH